ncbi:MAG: FKBP-type peptidyl-prolyl cis-trans isomerase [Prolixibacteraceae bacterium]
MKLVKYIYFVLFLVVVIGFASCKKTTLQTQIEDEKTLLQKYIDKFHNGANPTASGLYYFSTKEGTGAAITDTNYVKVFYRGYLMENNDTMGIQDGYEFDASGNYEPFGFTVGSSSVIKGWDEAIKLMKVGGEAKWVIPSKIAYGGAITGTIPAYSSLVFYVKVLRVYRTKDTFQTIQKVPKYILN